MPTATSPTGSGPRPTTRSIAELLSAAGEGDATAWNEIVRRYHRLVAAKVRSFTLQDADALDAILMTWLRLAENLHRLWFPERLAGWLATTASRECLHILRQAKRTAHSVDVVARDVIDPATGPEEHAIDADTVRAVGRLVAELPLGRRILVQALFADHPRSYTELARTIGIPIGSIGPNRARTLQQLRRMIDERGLGPGA
jgi:RNA polymerase sigma factor (sigma-70 family)